MLERVWREGNPLALSVGMQIDIATMDNTMEYAKKKKKILGIKLPYEPLPSVFAWGPLLAPWGTSCSSNGLVTSCLKSVLPVESLSAGPLFPNFTD